MCLLMKDQVYEINSKLLHYCVFTVILFLPALPEMNSNKTLKGSSKDEKAALLYLGKMQNRSIKIRVL